MCACPAAPKSARQPQCLPGSPSTASLPIPRCQRRRADLASLRILSPCPARLLPSAGFVPGSLRDARCVVRKGKASLPECCTGTKPKRYVAKAYSPRPNFLPCLQTSLFNGSYESIFSISGGRISREFGILLGVQWVCSFDALSRAGFWCWRWVWQLHITAEGDACKGWRWEISLVMVLGLELEKEAPSEQKPAEVPWVFSGRGSPARVFWGLGARFSEAGAVSWWCRLAMASGPPAPRHHPRGNYPSCAFPVLEGE